MAAMLKHANPVRNPPQGDESRVFVLRKLISPLSLLVDGQWSMFMVDTYVKASVETSRIFFIEGR
jgi:hypothetical protein